VPYTEACSRERTGIVIVATGEPLQATIFLDSLGFRLPGIIVLDRERLSHRILGLGSSVTSSLVTPFFKHIPTFGISAVWEALRVSLANIGPNGSHGSSWQQGGTFLIEHPGGYIGDPRARPSGGRSWLAYEWREAYPGDWRPAEEVLERAGCKTMQNTVSFKERLAFVIEKRNAHLARSQSESSTLFSIGTAALLATVAAAWWMATAASAASPENPRI
jgi:hypothetical protein